MPMSLLVSHQSAKNECINRTTMASHFQFLQLSVSNAVVALVQERERERVGHGFCSDSLPVRSTAKAENDFITIILYFIGC